MYMTRIGLVILPVTSFIDIYIFTDGSVRHKEIFFYIQNILNSNMTTKDISNLNDFEHFLSDSRINMSFDDYLLALRSSLTKPKMF